MPTETFNTPGANSWPCPAGVSSVQVEVWGAGGPGVKGDGDRGGAGGGGGGYAKKNAFVSVAGTSYTYHVGDHSANTNSVWDTATANAPSAVGGTGGTAAAGGNPGSPGAGGSGAGGDVNTSGGSGGTSLTSGDGGGGGGGSGGSSGNGNNGENGSAGAGGNGGSALADGGAGGNGSYSGVASDPGTAPGGGGGGSFDSSGASTTPGADGQIVLTYSYDAPTCSACDPSSGPIAGGTSVTLTTTGVRAGATIKFGGSDATNINIASDGFSATCDTPSHTAGSVDIVIENVDAQMGSLADGFEYVPPDVAGRSHPFRSHIFRSNRVRGSNT